MRLLNKRFEGENLPDSALVELWQNGNEYAFELLYKRHALQLMNITMQKVNDKVTAEEIVQDTFMNLYERKGNLPNIHSLPAYLYVSIKRKVLDLYKHEQVIKKYQHYMSFQAENLHRNSVSDDLETKELEQKLESEIQKIPAQARKVFTMRRMEELTNKQIASVLNISENTVEQHMRKALKLLKMAFYIIAFYCSQ